MRKLTSGTLALAAALWMITAGTAVAQDEPRLRIEAPQDGAIVPVTPGVGGMVVIEFDTDDFEIEELEDPQRVGLAEDTSEIGEGHVRVTVDEGFHWIHASDEPIAIGGLFPGLHTVTLELVTRNHQPLTPRVQQTLTLEVGGTVP